MHEKNSPLTRFFRELRRRRVFRVAGLYIIGAWVVMQAADVFFPAWGIPDAALRVLVVAAVAGFPVALVFGWLFDIGADGIRRTRPAETAEDRDPAPLGRSDYLVLTAFLLVAGVIVFNAIGGILQAPREESADGLEQAPVAAERPENSIAVLPFTNMSSDPENEYFADGLSEEILHRLTEFGELRVIGRTSSFAFKGSDYRIPRISALLGVRYLLQGSVRKHGNRLRISAQLLDQTGAQQWSEAFDRTFDDVFAIQAEIARVVAQTVAPHIAAAQRTAYEPDLEAYQHYLLGREYVHYRNVPLAREELAKAIELDPDFAMAHAEYAVAMTLYTNNPEDLERARQAIDRALELEPGLPRARAARGLQLQEKSPAEAEKILREVLADEPNMVDAINWLGGALSAQGKRVEETAVAERGFRVDPMNPTIGANLAHAYLQAGEPDKAERIFLRLDQLPEEHFYVVGGLAGLYWQTGRLVKMDRHIRRYVIEGVFSDTPGFRAYRHVYFAQSRALLGQWEQARLWAGRARSPVPDPDSIGSQRWVMLHYKPLMWEGRNGAAGDALIQAAASLYGSVSEAPSSELTLELGTLRALAGDHERAVRILEPALPEEIVGHAHEINAQHALAWSYSQTGEAEKARTLLEPVDEHMQELEAQGLLHASDHLFLHARIRLLMGDREGALDRLQQAVDAGWREYYLHHHDPRWNPLADDPRYQALMQRVKEDVDAQREEIERLETERSN